MKKKSIQPKRIKHSSLFMVITLIIIFSACKKTTEKPPAPPPPPTHVRPSYTVSGIFPGSQYRIKTLSFSGTDYGAGGTYTFSYNTDSLVSKITNDNSAFSYAFTYSGTKVATMVATSAQFEENDSLVYSYSGDLLTKIQKFQVIGLTSQTYTISFDYSYNASKQLTAQHFSEYVLPYKVTNKQTDSVVIFETNGLPAIDTITSSNTDSNGVLTTASSLLAWSYDANGDIVMAGPSNGYTTLSYDPSEQDSGYINNMVLPLTVFGTAVYSPFVTPSARVLSAGLTSLGLLSSFGLGPDPNLNAITYANYDCNGNPVNPLIPLFTYQFTYTYNSDGLPTGGTIMYDFGLCAGTPDNGGFTITYERL